MAEFDDENRELTRKELEPFLKFNENPRQIESSVETSKSDECFSRIVNAEDHQNIVTTKPEDVDVR